MTVGEKADTAIYGPVTIAAVYESESAARAGGYHMDAHVKGGAWPLTAWKVLSDGDRFAAVRVLTDAEVDALFGRRSAGGRNDRAAPDQAPDEPPARKPAKAAKKETGQLSFLF